MLSLNIALASVCSSNKDLDSVKINLTQDPFFIFSIKWKGVHTAGSYLIQTLLQAGSSYVKSSYNAVSLTPTGWQGSSHTDRQEHIPIHKNKRNLFK